MTVGEIWATIGGTSGVLALIVLLGVIKIKPLEISIWNWIFRRIGAAFNGEVIDKVNGLENKLDSHIKKNLQDQITDARKRILSFDSSLYGAKRNKIFYHTEEEFNDVLEDIDTYEKYCLEHPDYPNSKCLMAIEHIRKVYKKCKEEDSFI